MEKKKDVPNARDEIRKLQEALARKDEYPSSADELMLDDKDEQTANNFAARKRTRANTKS